VLKVAITSKLASAFLVEFTVNFSKTDVVESALFFCLTETSRKGWAEFD
jgi:hypothetical protein